MSLIIRSSWVSSTHHYQIQIAKKIGWDCDLPGDLLKEWETLLADIKEAIPVCVPRSYDYRVTGNPTLCTLCGFCDASTQAYTAVIYLVKESDTNTEVKFLVSNTRVVPLQTQTTGVTLSLSAFHAHHLGDGSSFWCYAPA